MNTPTALRFCANLHFLFTELPFLDRFAAAARAGFRGVEFPDPYSHPRDELAERLASNVLACVLLNFPMGRPGELGLACLPDRRQEFEDSVPRAIDTARALGCRQLNCMAGYAPPGVDAAELRATLVRNLRHASSEASRAGIDVLLEPLNTVDRPGLFLHGSEQAMGIIREVGADNLRLQFDCYHLQVMEGDLPGSLTRLLAHVGHIQIADAPGRHEPGTGQIPYPQLFDLLRASGYRRWIGAEYHPVVPAPHSFAWLPDRSG